MNTGETKHGIMVLAQHFTEEPYGQRKLNINPSFLHKAFKRVAYKLTSSVAFDRWFGNIQDFFNRFDHC